MISRAVPGGLREVPRAGRAAPHAARLDRHRPDHAPTTRATASSATVAGLYAHPTIVDGVRREDALYRTETFGPIVGVATFRTFDEAVELANGHGYGLSAAIYTTDPAHAFRFRRAGERGDGERQQLDVRRGGAPAVRRQRPLRQRLAAVRACGCSTSSPAGRASTGTTPASCRRPRWTRPTCPRTSTSAWRDGYGCRPVPLTGGGRSRALSPPAAGRARR